MKKFTLPYTADELIAEIHEGDIHRNITEEMNKISLIFESAVYRTIKSMKREKILEKPLIFLPGEFTVEDGKLKDSSGNMTLQLLTVDGVAKINYGALLRGIHLPKFRGYDFTANRLYEFHEELKKCGFRIFPSNEGNYILSVLR